jgi:hypothetical protein
MYLRINGDRKHLLIQMVKKLRCPFLKVAYFDGYKNVWFNFFK